MFEALDRSVDAAQAYGQAIGLLPDEPRLYRNRADTWFQLEKLDLAEQDIVRAVQLDPEHPYTHGRQGFLALARGQFGDASLHFDLATAKDGGCAWKYGLALAKLGQGDSDGAKTVLSAALDQADADDRAMAHKWLERVISLRPDLSVESQALLELLELANQR